MKKTIWKILDKLWCIARVMLYVMGILFIVSLLEDNSMMPIIGTLIISIPCILITLAIDIIRWGYKTKCPDCGRKFALNIIEKNYVDDEPILITEKCKHCNNTYTWESYKEVGKLLEISKVLCFVCPFIICFIMSMYFEYYGFAYVYIVYAIARCICKSKGKSRYIYEAMLFIGYGVDAYYCTYKKGTYFLECYEINEKKWMLILCIILILVCIISNIIRIVITTKLYNSQSGKRAERRRIVHERSLNFAVEDAANRIERATTYDERVRAEAALEKAKTRRDNYYKE